MHTGVEQCFRTTAVYLMVASSFFLYSDKTYSCQHESLLLSINISSVYFTDSF